MEEYTDEKLKRGIDLQNRLWDRTNQRVQKLFVWWKGESATKTTGLLISLLIVLNAYVSFPLLFKDNTPAFARSAFLQMIAGWFHVLGLSHQVFFGALTQLSLAVTVVALYLFVRKVAHGHELTGFLATLFFLIPNPLFGNEPVLISAILRGEGAHVIAFSLMLFVLLYIRSFVSLGVGSLAILAVVGSTIIALISPFSLFNLLILGTVIAISEGFLGNMRIKLARFAFLCICIFGLSLFWYYPHFVQQVLFQKNLSSAIAKAWSLFPIAIPLIPTLGTIAFLVFDRRPVLRPIFVALGIFVAYFLLYTVSKSINASGIFVAERYVVEMSFALSFLAALVGVFAFEIGFIRLKSFVFEKHIAATTGLLFGISFVASFTFFLLLFNVQQAHAEVVRSSVVSGVGGPIVTTRLLNIFDIGSDVALLVSAVTLYFLIAAAKRFQPQAIKEEIV